MNASAIAAGSMLGLLAGRRISGRIRTTLMHGLGLAVIAIGLKMALSADNLIPMVAV